MRSIFNLGPVNAKSRLDNLMGPQRGVDHNFGSETDTFSDVTDEIQIWAQCQYGQAAK